MLTLNRRTFLTGAALACAAGSVSAQLRIEVTGVGANQLPVAVPRFSQTNAAPMDVAAIVTADLERSGAFRSVRTEGEIASEDITAPRAKHWQGLGATALVIGTMRAIGDNRFNVHYRLFDTIKNVHLDEKDFTVAASELRLTGHRIADAVYEKLTGQGAMFASRLAYVVQKSAKHYELIVSDSDGANPQTALESSEPIISPTWSPNGLLLSYVSFELKKPVVYIHDVRSGQRRLVASFKGNNSAPAFSPDGQTMAVALSVDGGTHIYLMSLNGTNVRRFTFSQGIDTEPVFSRDGKFVYFTSDRGGSPQIYRQALDSRYAERMTFACPYAISPAVNHKGDKLAYVSRDSGAFRVTLLDLAEGLQTVLTDTVRDESPAFAPNGQVLVYATEEAGIGVLETVSLDGRVRTRLTGESGDIREPSWGPLLQ